MPLPGSGESLRIQLPFLLIDEGMPQSLNAAWKSALQYWAAAVAVQDQAGSGTAAPPRHSQRILDQTCVHVRLHAPAHHLASEQVDDGRQIHPALIGGDVRDVAAPKLIRGFGVEAALHQVGGNR